MVIIIEQSMAVAISTFILCFLVFALMLSVLTTAEDKICPPPAKEVKPI